MLGFLALCMVVSLMLMRSRLGYYLQAVRDNESAAEATGIGVLSTKLAAFAVSAGLTGIGGSLFMMYVRIVDPPTLLTLSDIGVRFALIALIGDVGTAYGPLLGALLVVPLEAWLRAWLGAYAPGSNLVVLGAGSSWLPCSSSAASWARSRHCRAAGPGGKHAHGPPSWLCTVCPSASWVCWRSMPSASTSPAVN